MENKPAYSFTLAVPKRVADALRKSFIIKHPFKIGASGQAMPLDDIEMGVLKKLKELGIYPFRMKDNFGNNLEGYFVDDKGCYWGTKNKPL